VAARYLFDMGSDLEQQIKEMKNKEGSEMKRLYKEIQWLRKVVKEWELCFGMEGYSSGPINQDAKENTPPRGGDDFTGQKPLSRLALDRLTPQQVKRRMEFQEKEMEKFKKQVEDLKLEAEKMRHVHQKAVEEAHEVARHTLQNQIQQINTKVVEMHEQNECAYRNTLQSKNDLIKVLEMELSELKQTVDPLRESMEEYKTYGKHVHRQLKVMRDAIAASKEMNQALYDELLNYQREMQGESPEEGEESMAQGTPTGDAPRMKASQILNHNHVHDLKTEILKQQMFIKQMKESHKQELDERDALIEELKSQTCICEDRIREYEKMVRQLEAARHMNEFYELKKKLPKLQSSASTMRQTIPNHEFFEESQPDHRVRRKEDNWNTKLVKQAQETSELLHKAQSKHAVAQ